MAATVPTIPAPAPIDTAALLEESERKSATAAAAFTATTEYVACVARLSMAYKQLARSLCESLLPAAGVANPTAQSVHGAGGLPMFLRLMRVQRDMVRDFQPQVSNDLGDMASFMFAASAPRSHRASVLAELDAISDRLHTTRENLTSGVGDGDPIAEMEHLATLALGVPTWGDAMQCTRPGSERTVTRTTEAMLEEYAARLEQQDKRVLDALAILSSQGRADLTMDSPEVQRVIRMMEETTIRLEDVQAAVAPAKSVAEYEHIHVYPEGTQIDTYAADARRWACLVNLVGLTAAPPANVPTQGQERVQNAHLLLLRQSIQPNTPLHARLCQHARATTTPTLNLLLMLYSAAQEVCTVEAGTSRSLGVVPVASYMAHRMGVPVELLLDPLLFIKGQAMAAEKGASPWPFMPQTRAASDSSITYWEEVSSVAQATAPPPRTPQIPPATPPSTPTGKSASVPAEKTQPSTMPVHMEPVPAAASAAAAAQERPKLSIVIPKSEEEMGAEDKAEWTRYIWDLLQRRQALHAQVRTMCSGNVARAGAADEWRMNETTAGLATSLCLIQSVHNAASTTPFVSAGNMSPKSKLARWLNPNTSTKTSQSDTAATLVARVVGDYIMAESEPSAADLACTLVAVCMGATHNPMMEAGAVMDLLSVLG